MSDQSSAEVSPPVYYRGDATEAHIPLVQLKEKDIQPTPIVNEMVPTLVGGIIVVMGFIFIRGSFHPENLTGFVFYMMFLTSGVFFLARGYIMQKQLIKSSQRIKKYSAVTYDERFQENVVELKQNDIRGVNLLFYTAASLAVIQYILAIYSFTDWIITEVTQWW